MRGSVTGPRSLSSAGRGGQNTAGLRGGEPTCAAKGPSPRRGRTAPHCWDGCSAPAIGASGEEQAQGRPWALGMFGLSVAL